MMKRHMRDLDSSHEGLKANNIKHEVKYDQVKFLEKETDWFMGGAKEAMHIAKETSELEQRPGERYTTTSAQLEVLVTTNLRCIPTSLDTQLLTRTSYR